MYRPEWLTYSHEQRLELAEHYGMKKSVSTEVVGNQLISDGFPDTEIYKLDKKETDKLLGITPKKDVKANKSGVAKKKPGVKKAGKKSIRSSKK